MHLVQAFLDREKYGKWMRDGVRRHGTIRNGILLSKYGTGRRGPELWPRRG